LARAAVDHPWLVAGGPPVVLGVGKFKLQKDFALLIRAFARVRGSRPARLIILGDGPRRDELEGLVNRFGLTADVALPGVVDNPYAWMSRASVFVLSSAWEGLPGVLIEAMACGCPVVSTDCPSGPAEILDRGKFGSLVPVGDEQAMADAILATLANPPSGESLRVRARLFSIDVAVTRYLELLAEQVNRAHAATAARPHRAAAAG
jgi:glycosyltransferase involved in cell wall biosynthesis